MKLLDAIAALRNDTSGKAPSVDAATQTVEAPVPAGNGKDGKVQLGRRESMNNDQAPSSKSRKQTQQTDQNDQQVDFGKAQGSSRNDEADLRDVARRAAKKSQQQNETRDE